MKFIRKKIKIITIIILILLSIGLITIKIYLNNNSTKNIKESKIEEIIIKDDEELDKKEEIPLIENIFVDIRGAVVNPGVYEIENDKKVIDVVNKAGGLTEKADTSMINLAKQLTNEMVIIIYTKEEVEKYTNQEEIIKIVEKECICPKVENNACFNNNENNSLIEENNKENEVVEENKQNDKINLNTANLEELQTLSGIGESKAKAIIEYRNEHKKFNNIEELKQVSGIGDALYEKIKNNITI